MNIKQLSMLELLGLAEYVRSWSGAENGTLHEQLNAKLDEIEAEIEARLDLPKAQ